MARSFAAAVLAKLGVPAGDARLVSRLLVRSDLRGVRTHGLKFLPVYARRLAGGGVKARPRVRTISRGAWGAVLDGDAGLGQVGASAAAHHAKHAARQRGLGFGACRNTSHVSALAPYLLDVVGGSVVIAFTNTGPSMAPPGGNFRSIGNNCMGFAAPVSGAAPLCLDLTTSTQSWGKVRDHIERGDPLPDGVALSPEGGWEHDPAAALAHTVAAPLGAGKGFGLALLIDVLAAGLTGGAFSPALRMLHQEFEAPEGTCAAFLVFSLARFPGGRRLPRRLAEWRQEIKRGKRTPGTRELFLPGERSGREEAICLARGFPMTVELRDELNELAASLGLRRRL
jgi:LDH2 family malate/lactate/ureidoglycolate dehydrogenase